MNGSLLLKATQARIKQITTMGLAAAISPLSWAVTDTGESLYGQHCAGCHAATLRGSAHGAALSGPAFSDKWSAASAQSFLAYQMQYQLCQKKKHLFGHHLRQLMLFYCFPL